MRCYRNIVKQVSCYHLNSLVSGRMEIGMHHRALLIFLLIFSGMFVFSACSNAKNHTQAEPEKKDSKNQVMEDNKVMLSKVDIRKINVYAYIGDDGRLVNRISYEVDDVKKIEGVKKEDFEIKIGDKSFAVKDIRIKENELLLETEDFHYDGVDSYNSDFTVTHSDFSVICTDPTLNFMKENCLIHTKTLDNFVSGTFKASNGCELPYWIYLPEDSGSSDVPLMVWEHGGGEVLSTSYEGANITKNKGASIWIESGMDTAVLSFQYPENYSFGISSKPYELKRMEEYNTVKYEFIQKLITDGQVDEKRLYISGASSGGGAVLRFLMQYPDLFAAALPICAKDTLIPISEPYGLAFKMQGSLVISDDAYTKCYTEIKKLMSGYDITHIPIWFVQAENDPVCTSYTSKILFDILMELGAESNRITMYTNEEMAEKNLQSLHASWIMAFNDPEIIKWIYEQSK